MPSRTFYTVDRTHGLATGDQLRLQAARDPAARRWFPAGLSHHGRDFVLVEDADAEGVRIELLLELLRRQRFPDRPSRLQSFFAFGSLAEARRFRREKQAEEAPIWELRAEEGHRGDMRHLQWRNGLLENLEWASQYWSGRPTRAPRWEFLLRPPVRVLGRADQKN